MATVPMRPTVIAAQTANARTSLRALRLEQIQIWGAAAQAQAHAMPMSFPERRSSLFEADFSSPDRPRQCRRTARHSLVRLAGDDDTCTYTSNTNTDSDCEGPENSGVPNDMVSRRPKVLRVASIDNLSSDDDDDYDNNGNNARGEDKLLFFLQQRHTPPDRISNADAFRSSLERRRLFTARAKSAVRPDSRHPTHAKADSHDHYQQPRARSFFEERPPANGSMHGGNTPFARARASIRLLGRYSRSRTARIPLFRSRFPNSSSRHSTR